MFFTINTIDMLTKIFASALLIFFASCSSSKETAKETSSNNTNNEQSDSKIMDAQMIKDGFYLGVIKHLKNSKCEYIIMDVKTKAQFDPINISEETYKAFRKDTQKVYYKYLPLRMMNRCNDANPISLIEIKKREG